MIFTVGVITQDSLIYKEAVLVYFTISINSLKNLFYSTYPDVQSQVFYLKPPYFRKQVIVHPLRLPQTALEKLEKWYWWMVPISTQQLFVSLMNSLALTAMCIQLILILIPGAIPAFRLVLAGAAVLFTTYIVQCIYANLKFNLRMSYDHVAMDGNLHPWFQKPPPVIAA